MEIEYVDILGFEKTEVRKGAKETIVVVPIETKAIMSNKAAEHLKRKLLGAKDVLHKALRGTRIEGTPVLDLYENKLALFELKDGILYFVKWVDID